MNAAQRWVGSEFESIQFGDKRLEKRFLSILTDLSRQTKMTVSFSEKGEQITSKVLTLPPNRTVKVAGSISGLGRQPPPKLQANVNFFIPKQ